MRKILVSILLPVMLLLASCSGSERSWNEGDWERCARILSTVPSDALTVRYSVDCRKSSFAVDSNSAFAGLGLKSLRGTGLAVAECYNGSVVQVLSLAPVPDSFRSDSTSAFSTLLARAAASGMKTSFIPNAPTMPQGQGVLLLSRSEVQLRASERHIREGRSILDLESFPKAIKDAGAPEELLVLRNSGAKRFIGKDFLGGIFTPSGISRFLDRLCEWTAFVPEPDGSTSVVLSRNDARTHYANLLSSLNFSDSRIGKVLPYGTSFVMDLPIDGENFRKAYESYQDASVNLVQYRRLLSELKSSCGKDPLKWEKELDIKEIAFVERAGCKIIMLRPGKAVEDREAAAFAYPGFCAALYGEAFSLRDESVCATRDGWIMIGSEKDLASFTTTEDELDNYTAKRWPTNGCRIIIYDRGEFIAWTKKGIRIWNSNL